VITVILVLSAHVPGHVTPDLAMVWNIVNVRSRRR